MLYYQELFFILEIIWIKLISQYQKKILEGYFVINKSKNLLVSNTIF